MEDSPEELVHEMLGLRFWGDNPLGQPILGTIPNIIGLDRDTLASFKQEAYTPAETVVCAAGKVDHDRFVDLIRAHMGRLPCRSSHQTPAVPRFQQSSQVIPRDLEQVQICMGVPGPSAADATGTLARVCTKEAKRGGAFTGSSDTGPRGAPVRGTLPPAPSSRRTSGS